VAWIYLIAAGILETLWAVAMKASNGFTLLIPSLITVLAMIGSVALLALAMKTLPLGTAYVVWTGIGAVGAFAAVGAQNVHWENSGAFTGEISAQMLREAGAEYVLTGHSERRALFGETDETVAKRTVAALKEGLKVVMCVGETLEQRESGLTEKVLEKQLREGLKYVDADMMSAVSVAYEPVWAIGTGKTASAEQARDAIACLRGVLGGIFDAATAESTYILYGGSMNEKNAFSLLSMKGVDGGLIGGASLDAEKFISIIKAYDNTERKI